MLPLSCCNYVACLWKASALANFEISAHGWTSEYEIQWLDEIFWADYEEISTYGNDNKNKSDIMIIWWGQWRWFLNGSDDDAIFEFYNSFIDC